MNSNGRFKQDVLIFWKDIDGMAFSCFEDLDLK